MKKYIARYGKKERKKERKKENNYSEIELIQT